MRSLTASEEWFIPWRTISSENDKPQVEFELEKIVSGFFRPDLFLGLYDIEHAKNDNATVAIYYESRMAKLDFNREEIAQLDKNVEEGEEVDGRELIVDGKRRGGYFANELAKSKWAKLVCAMERVGEIGLGTGGPLRNEDERAGGQGDGGGIKCRAISDP